MTRNALILAAIAMPLAACATADDVQSITPADPPMAQCDASGAQDLIGQGATAQLGAQLLYMTGATQLRWVPPRTAVTMDYRADRLTVSYDDDMMIERISCG